MSCQRLVIEVQYEAILFALYEPSFISKDIHDQMVAVCETDQLLHCSILLLLRISFNISIVLDEASCPSRWSHPYLFVHLCVFLADRRNGVDASSKLYIPPAGSGLHAAKSSWKAGDSGKSMAFA